MRRTSVGSAVVWSVLVVLGILVLPYRASANADGSDGARAVQPLVGVAACPVTSKKEVAFTAYAVDNPTPCATVISCTNLDKASARVTCQFLFGFSNTQVGDDAVLDIPSGATLECGTRSSDPVGMYVINASASTGNFEGKARICSSTKKVACESRLVCSTAAGIALDSIKVILKKQKGD